MCNWTSNIAPVFLKDLMFADTTEAPRNKNQKLHLTFVFAPFQDQEGTRGFHSTGLLVSIYGIDVISVWIYKHWILTNRRTILKISPCKHTIFLAPFSLSFLFVHAELHYLNSDRCIELNGSLEIWKSSGLLILGYSL